MSMTSAASALSSTEKASGIPSVTAKRRSVRCAIAWKVPPVTCPAGDPLPRPMPAGTVKDAVRASI